MMATKLYLTEDEVKALIEGLQKLIKEEPASLLQAILLKVKRSYDLVNPVKEEIK